MDEKIVQVVGLKKYFNTKKGVLHAVDDVNFSIERGKTLGVVGESGCGKSTLGRMLVHLEESTEGTFMFKGQDATVLRGQKLKTFRENAKMIFQDPYSSLNPRYTVEDTIKESLVISGRYSRGEIADKVKEVMELVGIDRRLSFSYPHELDGGRRQRVGIARALALEPEFVVCDEPVSALDVSIQAQILNLLKRLQQQKQFTYMFITHDLSVVRHISDNICVMYLGQIVEMSPSKELFKQQIHPYTKALISAIPLTDIHTKMNRIILRGEITSPIDPEPGCRFAARCNYYCDRCREPQHLEEIAPGHFVSCCRAKEIN